MRSVSDCPHDFLREPDLPQACLADIERAIKQLLDHREDQVWERSRIQGRLRWHLHDIDPSFEIPGNRQRHRLNRKGNRQLNTALHRIAVTQCRVHEPARLFMARKMNEGKGKREALGSLNRHLMQSIFRTLKARDICGPANSAAPELHPVSASHRSIPYQRTLP
jgi:hypothetical protein